MLTKFINSFPSIGVFFVCLDRALISALVNYEMLDLGQVIVYNLAVTGSRGYSPPSVTYFSPVIAK